MNRCYSDILSRIPEEPKWFDENAVPRYCEFEPKQCSNIYADERVLFLICCQACQHEFKVCLSRYHLDEGPEIKDLIQSGDLHYGDPPNIECCAIGLSMSSDSVKVLEYWKKENWDWVRDTSLEVELES